MLNRNAKTCRKKQVISENLFDDDLDFDIEQYEKEQGARRKR